MQIVSEPNSFVAGNCVVKARCGAFLLSSSSRGDCSASGNKGCSDTDTGAERIR